MPVAELLAFGAGRLQLIEYRYAVSGAGLSGTRQPSVRFSPRRIQPDPDPAEELGRPTCRASNLCNCE